MKKHALIAMAAIMAAVTAGCGRNQEAILSSPSQEEGSAPLPQASESAEPSPTETAALPSETEPAASPAQTEPADSPSQTETAEIQTVSEPEADAAFSNIELDIKKGTLYIRSGDSLSLTRHDGDVLDYQVANDTLYVSINHTGEMVLTLPKDSYEALQLDVENGHIYLEGALSLTSLELNLEEGEVKLENLSVSENSSIHVKKGTAFLYGDLGEEISADCDKGHLSLSVPYKQDDYNYEILLSGGDIRIGSKNYHGKTTSETIDNNAAYSMRLNCSQGDISVQF